MALAAVMTLFVSPYNYDYDFACLGFAVSLILPELLPRMRIGETAIFYLLCWTGSGAGLLQHYRAVLIWRDRPPPWQLAQLVVSRLWAFWPPRPLPP
jgi:hypothetical protein